jgi:hypothetical protein
MADPTSTLSWDAFPDATSYEVQIKNLGGTVVSGPDDVGNVTSTSLGDLMAGVADGNYTAQVRAEVGAFVTDWSEALSFTWSNLYPGTVTGLAIV